MLCCFCAGPVAYVQVASKQLVGLYLTVWAKAELLPHLKGLQATQVATGFGGYLGNKGEGGTMSTGAAWVRRWLQWL